MKKDRFPEKKFGKALVMARLQKGVDTGREMSMSEIAAYFQVTPGFWSQLERGDKLPSLEMVVTMTSYFSSSAYDLLKALGVQFPE